MPSESNVVTDSVDLFSTPESQPLSVVISASISVPSLSLSLLCLRLYVLSSVALLMALFRPRSLFVAEIEPPAEDVFEWAFLRWK